MTADAVLADLERAGVLVALCEDGTLDIDAPQGLLTEPLIDRIRASKPELVALLSRQGPDSSQPVPGAPVLLPGAMCVDCGAGIGFGYARCEPCARLFVERRPELPAPCPECREFFWFYDTAAVRRCVACGHTVELPPLHESDPLVVAGAPGGLLSWEECHCDGMPAGQTCRACASAAVARWKATRGAQ